MSIYSVQEFDLLIQKATSESIPNGELDLPYALEVSDVVRSRKLPPKDCMRCLKKRITTTTDNPNTQLSSWKLVDVCVKNGGTAFLVEICSREFMDTFEHTILKLNENRRNMDSDELYTAVTKLFYELYVAFKNDSQLHYIANVYSKLKSRGIEFPTHLVDESNPMAMFDSKTPADWVDSDACMICSKKFSVLNRRHHCRSCGGIFCQEHSSHNIPLPDLGITEEVRVCDNCFEDYDLKKHKGHKKKKRSHSSKHKRNSESYSSENEDEDLKRAIELSLQETGNAVQESPSPVVEPVKSSSQELEMEEDADLKAAIEASLREAEEAKARNSYASVPIQNNSMPQFAPAPSNDLTTAEEEDIYLFASLVEKMKTQSVTDILEDTQLQRLYQKVIASKPKINNSLNEKINKYNTLIEMNSKISDIMNIYDSLLEQQLRNINISQQYSLPQQPSDPYAITQPLPNPTPNKSTVSPVQNQYAQPVQQQMQPPHSEYSQESAAPITNGQSIQQPVYPVHEEPQQSSTQVPSEPPYPDEPQEDNSDGKEHPAVEGQSEPKENLPYPKEQVEQETGPQKITNFDFPAVPAHKVQGNTPYNEEAVPSEPPQQEAEEPKEEELLLEL